MRKLLEAKYNKHTQTNEYIEKYCSLTDLKQELSDGKEYFIDYTTKGKEIDYRTIIHFWRLDIIDKETNKKYKKETYVLLIERGDARYYIEEGNLVIDIRLEFHKLEELIDYLVKNKYVKKSEIIKKG